MTTKNCNQTERFVPEKTELTTDEQKLVERHQQRMAARSRPTSLARRLECVMFYHW